MSLFSSNFRSLDICEMKKAVWFHGIPDLRHYYGGVSPTGRVQCRDSLKFQWDTPHMKGLSGQKSVINKRAKNKTVFQLQRRGGEGEER